MPNLFKTFTTYKCARDIHQWCRRGQELHEVAPNYMIIDPLPTSWRSIGLVEPVPGLGTVVSADATSAHIIAVQIAERILPGAVLRAEVARRAKDLEDRDGFKPGRKRMAELRDDAETSLLPKAFIRRKTVLVAFDDRRNMLIFNGSAKTCDDVLVFLSQLFAFLDLAFEPKLVRPRGHMRTFLANVAKDVDFHDNLAAAESAVLALDRKVVRVRDRDIYGAEIQGLLKEGYEPTELGVYFTDDSSIDANSEFRITENLIVKGFKAINVKPDREGSEQEQFVSNANFYISEIHPVLTFINSMGVIEDDEEL